MGSEALNTMDYDYKRDSRIKTLVWNEADKDHWIATSPPFGAFLISREKPKLFRVRFLWMGMTQDVAASLVHAKEIAQQMFDNVVAQALVMESEPTPPASGKEGG